MSEIKSNPCAVGASRVDISPQLGTHLSGDGWGRYRPTREILDRLFATAMVFEAGGRRVCVIALDLTAVAEPFSRQVRETVATSLGIQPEAVLVCATQTHSAPSMGSSMLSPDFPLTTVARAQSLPRWT